MPTPSRRPVAMPAPRRLERTSSWARSRLSVGAWSTSAGEQSSATSSPERSQIATRMCWWPKSRPTAKAAPGTSDSRTGRAPGGPWALGARGLVLLDHAGLPELLDQRRDRGPRETGPAGEVGAARARLAVEHLDDAQPVHLTQAQRGRVAGHPARNIPTTATLRAKLSGDCSPSRL